MPSTLATPDPLAAPGGPGFPLQAVPPSAPAGPALAVSGASLLLFAALGILGGGSGNTAVFVVSILGLLALLGFTAGALGLHRAWRSRRWLLLVASILAVALSTVLVVWAIRALVVVVGHISSVR
jgi:hypothetical protein